VKTRTTLLLLWALAALCLAYWLVLRREEGQRQEAVEAKRVFSFAPAELSKITVEREGERPTDGMRNPDGSWRIISPYALAANQQVWERVAKHLAELSNERTIEELPMDPSLYGLDTPYLRVTASAGDNDNVAVVVGNLDPTKKFRYARLPDGPVFLVHPDTVFELDRDLLWLRDRQLVNIGPKGITRIECAPVQAVREGDVPPDAKGWIELSALVVERDADGQWQLVQPEGGRVDQEAVENYATHVRFAVGRNYVDAPEDLADYSLDPPKARLTVTSGDFAPQTVYFGAFEADKKEDAGVYATRETGPAVFVVDAQLFQDFPKSAGAWYEKRLLSRSGADIATLEYEAGEQSFTLINEQGGAWRLTRPVEGETDQIAVSQFVSTLRETQGVRYHGERRPEFGLDHPAIRIRVAFRGEEKPAEILVGAPAPDGRTRYAQQDTGAAIEISNEDVEALQFTVSDMTVKLLLRFEPDRARAVSMRFDGTAYRFEKGDRNWLIREPEGKLWDSQSDMKALLDAFSRVRAESVKHRAMPPNLSAYGLDKPLLTVEVTLDPETERGEPEKVGPFNVGKPDDQDPHQRFATVAGRQEVFLVRQALVDTIRDAMRGVVDSAKAGSE
jgi:hypothetical protein